MHKFLTRKLVFVDLFDTLEGGKLSSLPLEEYFDDACQCDALKSARRLLFIRPQESLLPH